MSAGVKSKLSKNVIHVIQGEQAISGDPDAVMTTVLGSCVATTLFDPLLKIGGMNHFLLPGNPSTDLLSGAHAMELLINELLKQGASKKRLQAKLFGGGQVVKGLSRIGERNADFARRFLADEGIPCVGESLGGKNARRVRFWPTTNRVAQMLVTDEDAVQVDRPRPKPAPEPVSNDIELF